MIWKSFCKRKYVGSSSTDRNNQRSICLAVQRVCFVKAAAEALHGQTPPLLSSAEQQDTECQTGFTCEIFIFLIKRCCREVNEQKYQQGWGPLSCGAAWGWLPPRLLPSTAKPQRQPQGSLEVTAELPASWASPPYPCETGCGLRPERLEFMSSIKALYAL